MKLPDEIKRGLELCTLSYVKCVSKCPYAGDDCVERLVTDAIDLIQIHEESIEKKNNGLFELVLIIKQLEAERDAAIKDMTEMAQYVADDVCTWCNQKGCKGCAGVPGAPNFNWRGVQKEDGNA